MIDPVCYYDPDNQRFVVAITTLHVDEDGDFNGKNTIDVAVSNTGNPTGAWTVYKIPAQNDGADGTPDHHCTVDGSTPGPCFQDYPHIGADKNGVYITSNEYDLFGPSFNAAQILAFSKAQLAAHPFSLAVTPVENLSVDGSPGFTVWPATSNAGDYAGDRGGTEYFLSTIAGDGSETGNPTGTARRIGLWAVTNTSSLNSGSPSLGITSRLINSQDYVVPPPSNQKAGSTPLADCINDTTIATPFGPGCWNLFFVDEPAHDEVESTPDSATPHAAGVVRERDAVGLERHGRHGWRPSQGGHRLVRRQPEDQRRRQGRGPGEEAGLSRPCEQQPHLSGRRDGCQRQGGDRILDHGSRFLPERRLCDDRRQRVGWSGARGRDGLGPADGFTSYKAFVGDPPRTRWGDYGAAVTDGSSIWIASEYIAQTCTLPQYLTGAIGSCGGTRTSLANWATRVSKLAP